MLARLTAVPGVRECRVDATGRFFLVVAAEGADPAAVRHAACAALGERARALDDAGARAQLARRDAGDPWYAPTDLLGLSYLEARVLSVRIAADVARAAGLALGGAAAIEDAAREVLCLAMERIHAEGGRPSSGWFYEEWPALAAAISARAAPRLAPADRPRAETALAALHAR